MWIHSETRRWQLHRTDNCSQQSSIILPVLSRVGFESSCGHLSFRFSISFEQGDFWHSGNYRVCTHSETRTLHSKNIQSKCIVQISTHNRAQSFHQFGQTAECWFRNWVVVGLSPPAATWTSDFASALRKEFLHIQTTIECGFTLKQVHDITRRYSQNSP